MPAPPVIRVYNKRLGELRAAVPESWGKEGVVRGLGVDPGMWSVTQFASQLLCHGRMASVSPGGELAFLPGDLG